MRKKMKLRERLIIVPEDELCEKADPYVLLGHSSTAYKIAISKTLSTEYKKHIPSAMHRFTCADCGASFIHFHMLSNHLHLAHMTGVNISTDSFFYKRK